MAGHRKIGGKGDYVVSADDAESVAYETKAQADAVAKNIKGAKVTPRTGGTQRDPGKGDDKLSRRRHGHKDGK